MKNTNKRLISSVLAIVICFTMLIGTTFAWFTDSSSSGINTIQSGNLDVRLDYTNSYNGEPEEVTEDTKIFMDINGNPILWEPGASASGRFLVSNNGMLALKYELKIIYANATETPSGKTLADALSVYAIARNKTTGTDDVMEDAALESIQIDSAVPAYDPMNMPSFKDGFTVEGFLLPGEAFNYEIGVCWIPGENDNEFNVEGGLNMDFAVSLVATQVSYENDGDGFYYDMSSEFPEFVTIPSRTDVWDGTADTSWYDPENPQTEYVFDKAEQLAGLSELISGDTTFEGVTIYLANDLDLYCEDTSENADGDPVTFRPIGDKSKNGTFEGTFDGQGHTISNLYQNGWDLGYQWGVYGSYGLFGIVNNATIKNLTIAGAESYIEGGDVGGICGSAEGTCVFENITIEDSDFATYNNGNGGIIGWSGAGDYTFKNITIAEDVTLAGLWGSFDSSIGGIVGQAEPGATYNFENVEVNCRLDVYNDCTASYDYYNYRMCGMLIGRCAKTINIDGANYPDMSQYNVTFTNVTVNYGDWMNYHYCDPTPGYNNGRGMRVEPGYSYDGLPADYDHSQCAAHHNKCIPFNQIIGGDQLGVKGLPNYEGVTVNYPASYNP